MRPIRWDENPPLRWGNPNLRWGNPSYLLEPGDPGYTPPPDALPSTPQPRKTKKMPKADYISDNDEAFAAQLDQFQNNIGGYATTLGVPPEQVAAQAADAAYFEYLVDGQATMQDGAKQWTTWKNLVRGGGTPPAAGAPLPPTFPASVPAVPLGVEARFRALVRQIKAHANYNAAAGQALGIEGAQQTGPDLTTVQPELKLAKSGDTVKVGWGWGGNAAFLDQCEIEVDRGSGWGLLAIDTTPNYNDTAPPPATPTKWKYRAIYRVGDARVGQWSNEVSLTAGG